MILLPLQASSLCELRARYSPAEALLSKRRPDPRVLQFDGAVLSHGLYQGEAGVRMVEGHHRALFASTEGQDLPALLGHFETAGGEHATLRRAQDADLALLDKTEPTRPAKEEEGEGIPWNGWDLAQAIFYFSLAAVLIVVGLRGIGMALELSGLEVFDASQPSNRILYSFVLVGLAAVLKTVWSNARTDTGKHLTACVISITGICAGVLWGWLFSQAFGEGFSAELPTFTIGGTEPDTDGGGAHGGPVLTWLGIIAEALISAACWIQGSMLMEKHRPACEKPNPKAVAIEGRLNARNPLLSYLADLTARLQARIEAIRQACAVFATSAVARLKNAMHNAQRRLLAVQDLEALARIPARPPDLDGVAVLETPNTQAPADRDLDTTNHPNCEGTD